MEMFNLIHAVNTAPWVMEETTLKTLLEVFDSKLNTGELVALSDKTKSDWKVDQFATKSGKLVDYFLMSGTMVPRTGGMRPQCGMIPMIGAANVILESESPYVILHMDSGGGNAVAVPEFAEAVKELKARGQTVIGYTDTVAASGGYWALAHCNEIYAAPSARVGSIGVYTAITKRTNTNYKTHIIKAGKNKAFGSADLALTDEEIAYFTASVKETYKDFTESVAEGRGVAVQKIVETEAAVYAAKRTNLLVDELMTFTQLKQEILES